MNLCVVSYEIFAADEDEFGQETVTDEAQARGLRAIENDFAKDDNYNPFPGRVSIHDNTFNNANLLPTFSNDFGLLWLYKNKASIPDIAYDGIISPDGSLQDEEHKLCIRNNANASFFYLDASHDFEGFTSDKTPFDSKLNE